MRLICPHCMSGVTVPDDAAGRDATCPNCGKAFPTPARYAAEVMSPPVPPPPIAPPPVPVAPEVAPPTQTVVTPPAPPGYIPPVPPVAPSGFLPGTPAPAPALPTTEYTGSIGLSFSPKVVAWLPPIFLLLTLILTTFTWVGSYGGNTAVYSQGPWRALFGKVYRNIPLEKVIPIPAGWIDNLRSDWGLMLPYLLVLLLAVGLAWADRWERVFDTQRYRQLAGVWANRQGVIFGLATLALLLSVVQVSRGFGMERAMRQVVDERFADARAKAANSPSAVEAIDYEKEQEYAKFHLETTTWAYLAIAFNALAVLAAIARWLLARRPNRLPPRLVLHY